MNLDQCPSSTVFARLLHAIVAIFLFSLPAAHASHLDFSPKISEARLKGNKYVVTSTKDSGAGSLRQAIKDAAKASADGSVITFSSKLNGKTIVLSSGELLIASNTPPLEITAADLSKGVKIDARQTSRIFNVEDSTDVHLQNLTITGGKTAVGIGGSGGAIYTEGTLNLTDCVLTGNATGDGVELSERGGHGGAIYNDGGLTLSRCVLTNNTAGNGALPDGRGGRGGAIYNQRGIFLTNSTIDGNRAGNAGGTGLGGGGGGIYNDSIGDIIAENTTISRNRAGNKDATALGGAGGAIFAGGKFELSNCTIAENHAGLPNGNGGGIFANAGIGLPVTLQNCTVAGNEAKGTGKGGGIWNNQAKESLILENTIVSNNTPKTEANVWPDYASTSGVNFIINTPLSSLGDYGGLTETMPPIPGDSDANIFGNGALAFLAATDQRGVRRIPGRPGVVQGRQGDVGAVEVSTDCQLLPRLMIEWGATVYTVTSPKDSGKGTLRQAVLDAQAADNPDGAVIVFSTKMNGKTVTLTSGELVIFGKTAILGASLGKGSTEPVDLPSGVAISGNKNSRVVQTHTDSDVLMRNLTIRDGLASVGAGLYTRGHLLMCDCVVTDNESTAGGGIFVSGASESTVIIRSKISNNLVENEGGGIYSSNQLVCVDSEISGNRTGDVLEGTSGKGAGVLSTQVASVKFSGCTISDNHTGAGPNRGLGGGVFLKGLANFTNCTFSGNSAGDGGGLFADGGADLVHCTIVGNSADNSGGGVAKAQNTVMKNTIVSDNTSPVNPNNEGDPTDNGDNFFDGDALLLPLGDYGGPTKTMPPSSEGSPVVNKINTIDVAQDQIGAARGRFDDAEIGAVDFTPAVLNFAARAEDPTTPLSPDETNVNAIDPAAAGTFSGILTDPTTRKAVGTMTVKMSASGAISVSVSSNGLGVKASAKTTLANDGSFLTVIDDYTLSLQLVRTAGGENKFKFDGAFGFGRVGETQYDVSLDRSGYNSKTNKAPMAGKYTSLLPAMDLFAKSAPQGDGYGLVTVGTNGKVKFAGALGDGTKFTVGGFVSEDSEWRLFKDLYRTKPKGNIGGVVTFADLQGVSDFNGSLSWMKTADTREKLYKDGFNIETQKIIGSLYNAPYPNEAILAPIVTNQPHNATFNFGKGNIDTPDMKYLTWDGRNRVKANGLASGQSLKIVPSTKSGLVKGSYIDKSTRQKISFAGVAFQKQNVISGYFPGKEETGFFAIRPSGGGVLRVETREGFNLDGAIGDFGNAGVDGGIGVSNEFHVVNTGNGNLTVFDIEVDGNDFFLVNAPSKPKVLTPGERFVFYIGFNPSSLGQKDSTFSVRSDGGDVKFFTVGTGVEGSGADARFRQTDSWNGNEPTNRPAEFSAEKKSYNPLIHGGTYQGFTHQGAEENVTGFVTVKAGTKNGLISGSAVINGVKESFKGTVNPNGTFASATNRGRNVSFELSRVTNGSGGFKLIGAFAGDNGDHQFELVRSGFHKTTNPNTAFDGLFTMVLPSTGVRGNDAPNGDGYGTASIGIDGKTKSTLVLGDGTKATHAGFVSVDGEWLIHKDLYRTKPKGFIAGRLLFRDVANISDFDGELQWVKRADRREKRFNRGFEIRQITLGSGYTPPAVGERAFAPPAVGERAFANGDIILDFTDGDVPNIPARSFGDWATTNKVVIETTDPTQKFAVKVNSKNGVVTGTYTDSLRKKKIPFGGVIFEKQDILTGHFIGTDNTGLFGILRPDVP